MEAFSVLLRQVHATIRRVYPESPKSTYPPIHGRFVGRYLEPNRTPKSLIALGQTATESRPQMETRERLLGRFATVGTTRFRDRHQGSSVRHNGQTGTEDSGHRSQTPTASGTQSVVG